MLKLTDSISKNREIVIAFGAQRSCAQLVEIFNFRSINSKKITSLSAQKTRHCEERSDEAIS
jgi:hypothetical protein